MKTSSSIMKFDSGNPFVQKIQLPNQQVSRVCPSCGAPALSEVCQYCGTYVGAVATSELTPEYELVHCKNAKLSFWNAAFPAFFGIPFLCGGIGSFLGALALSSESSVSRAVPILSSFMFLLIGVVALFILFMNIKRFLDTKKHGVVR